jgi:hypothetical protein
MFEGRSLRASARVLVVGLLVALIPAARSDAQVPQATGDDAVITVHVGGDRAPDGSVRPLAGVVLELRTYTGSASTPGPPVGTSWSTCTSDADGDCSFVVPNTQAGGTNRNARFWVTQASAPDGWFTNPDLRTGTATAAESATQPYRFLTGSSLQAGNIYRSGTNFMAEITSGSAAAQRPSSGGVWQQSRVNPRLPSACGLDVALILDLSGSVGADLPNLKAAADGFVNSLVGTPSRMSVFSFSWGSPAQLADRNHPELQPVSDAGGAGVVKGWYAGWGSSGGTNWDRGIAAAAFANGPRRTADRYDLAIVLTDGNPTNWGGTGTTAATVNGNGSNNRIREVEEAIFSANALKAKGTRVVAFGIGAGVTDATTAHNLRAISGATAYDGTNARTADYFQEPNYASAANALHDLALTGCAGTVSVVKMIVPSSNTGDDVSGAVPAPGGWVFDASSAATPPVPVDPSSATTTDDGTGSVNFDLDFSAGAPSADLTVTEVQQPDHVLVQSNGSNAVCTDLGTGDVVPVTNVGAPTDPNPGFVVQVAGSPAEQALSCIVYDRPPAPPPPDADLTVDKLWVVDADGTSTTYPEGTQPDFLQAGLTVTGPLDGMPAELGWGVPATGFREGDTPTIDETVHVNRPLCALDSATVTEANGAPAADELPYTPTLAAGSNHYTVTNVVTCTTRLTLRKVVHNRGVEPPAEPGDWTLSATGPTPVVGQGNSAAVTDRTIDPGDYALAESGGPSGYRAGGWYCTGAAQTGPDSVSTELGQDVTCTIQNVAQVSRPGRGTPVVRTRTSSARVTPGRPFTDHLRVRGLAGGQGATATARLYGPFASRAAAVCRPRFLARTTTLHVHNGRNRTPAVRVASTGVYTWRVRIHADERNRSATHPCGQASETTVVAKHGYVSPIVNGGFSGTVRPLERAGRPPVEIRMPAIGLDAPVRPERVVAGRMTLPDQVGEVGWLRRSAGFGDKIGTAVVAGHVSDRHDSPGALYRLRAARPGDLVTVVRHGVRYRYRVAATATYDRRHRLPHRYFVTTGRHRLVLISCTAKVVYPNGHFHYTRYLVVVAHRVR